MYNLLKTYIPIASEEYERMEKQMIHGDFGLRNIKLWGTSYTPIDFERIKQDIAWSDLTKFSQRECKDKQLQERFLQGYRSITTLEEPSGPLKLCLDFITALGIYKYTLKKKDMSFEMMGDGMLEEIKERL